MLIGQKIVVLGGGIGGLAAARALALKGAQVEVLERAAAISEVGAGLQISPNGLRVLDAIGLGDEVRAKAMRAQAVVLSDGLTGRDVLRMDLAARRPKQAFLLIHRADLIDVLAKGATEAGVKITLGADITAAQVSSQNAVLTAADGRQFDTRFVVGAGGLHSLLRQEINGHRAPFFTGQVAWRALVPAVGGEAAEARVRMGPKRHMVSYPLRGASLINIVAVEERPTWAEEGWSIPDDPANLRAAFKEFAADAQALLDRVEQVHIWGLHRHPVANQWHKGAAAILGDAAHPTLPFMAQGAVMALEDAWVLADCLGVAGLDEGPALYQARRRHRAAAVIEAANQNAKNYHHANPAVRFIGHTGLRLAGRIMPEQIIKRFDWIYDYDVTQND